MTRFIFHKPSARLAHLFGIVLIAKVLAINELRVPQLPIDEIEAHRMLAEGTLDSAVWQKVEPFYVAPLCVSRGELRILYDLFPGLTYVTGDSLVNPKVLASYEPWDAKAQRRFFGDFPGVLPFYPILSFDSPQTYKLGGRVGFYFSRRAASDTARQYALFSLNGSRAEVGGRIDFTDAYGRWNRRALTFTPTRCGKVTVGNFVPEKRERLLYGYFPSFSTANSRIADNWLYGTSGTWNGVCIKLTRANEDRTVPVTGEAFFHTRPAERIASLDVTIPVSNHISSSAGASGLTTFDSSGRINDLRYIHTSLALGIRSSWKAELGAGMDAGRPSVIPWYFSWTRRSKRIGFDGMLARVPKGFTAPRGEIIRYLLDRCDMGDTARENLITADISFHHALTDWLNYSPRLECIFVKDIARRLSAAMEFRGKGRLNYRIGYSWSSVIGSGSHDTAMHQQVMQWSYGAKKNVELECSQNAVFAANGYWRLRLMVSPWFQAGAAVRLSPLLFIRGSRNTPLETGIGIKKTLLLFNKTFSELKIEQSPPFSSLESIHAQGKMSFVF